MKIKEIHKNAGSLTSYLGYILILFVYYLFLILMASLFTDTPETSGVMILGLLLRLLIGSFVLAGVFGSVHDIQTTPDVVGGNRFFKSVITYFLRFSAAYLLIYITYAIVAVVVAIVLTNIFPNIKDMELLAAVINSLLSVIGLFWYSAIVVERKLFRGLYRAIQTLLSNRFALAVGVLWAIVGFADTVVFELQGQQIPVVVNGVRAGVLAICRILVIMYSLAVYKNMWDSHDAEPTDQELVISTSRDASGDKLVNTGFGFAFFSFIPLIHLVALVLGIMAMKRKQRFVIRSAIACCFGGFFTIFYLLITISMFLNRPAVSDGSGYEFLAEVNADMQPYVSLLEDGELTEVSRQIESDFPDNLERHWSVDCASAMAKGQNDDLEGALSDFRRGAGKNPQRSEFYYYYGRALLDNEQPEAAIVQFNVALTHEPENEIAQQYITLIETTYEPSIIVSSLLLVVVLLILFTLHEYGHAFAAWKLGDDTAKEQGRLTLNPLRHLDPIGSVVLPAILLWQQTGVIFGWAKPVPVNPANFKEPNRDHMKVSFAGPAANLIVSMLSILLLGFILLFIRILWPESLSLNISAPFAPVSIVGPPSARWITYVVLFLKQLFYTSIVLGIFNLIPIPPLDGSWIFAGIMPQRLRDLLERGRRFSYLIFLLLVITPALDYFLAIPISIAWGVMSLLFYSMGFA